jgi:hypothetical protein
MGSRGALLTLLFAAALGPPPEPPVVIFLEGGAGVIRADHVWEDGDRLCWEARGIRYCLPLAKIESGFEIGHRSSRDATSSPVLPATRD